MQGTKEISADMYEQTLANGGAMNIPTTDVKLWIDPNNGKYLGKYDEFEFAADGILYGKADEGKNAGQRARLQSFGKQGRITK